MRRALWFALLALGCQPDFDEVSTVKDLRVLGIVADTSEILFDGGPLSMQQTLCLTPDNLQALALELLPRLPESFPPVTLRPLVVDPRGAGRPVHYRAVVCVSPTGAVNPMMGGGTDVVPGGVRTTIGRGECPADAPLVGEGDAVPTASGVVPIELRLVPTRELVLGAFRSDVLGAVYGLPLTVQVTVSAGGEEVIARKRVLVATKLAPDQLANFNPFVSRVVHRRDEEGEPTPFDLADPLANPPLVSLGKKLIIEPEHGAKEMYPSRIGDRRTGCVATTSSIEAQRFSFFATVGSFGPATTNTEPPVIRDPGTDKLRLASTYQAPRALQPGESDLVRIWIVTRDERAGASFVELALRLVP